MIDQNSQSRVSRPGERRSENINKGISLVAGGALVVFGISRRSLAGTAVAATGGYLIYRGFSRQAPANALHIEKTLTIMRPVREVYAFWRDFSNLPKVMKHLREVHTTGERFSHWTLQTVMGLGIEWDAELTNQTPNEYLGWHTCPGAPIEHRGSVQFCAALNGEGTELSVHLQYVPPGGRLGEALAKLFGHALEAQIREDLRAMKALLETGEIPTTDGQPSGSRSAFRSLSQAARRAMVGDNEAATGQTAAS